MYLNMQKVWSSISRLQSKTIQKITVKNKTIKHEQLKYLFDNRLDVSRLVSKSKV